MALNAGGKLSGSLAFYLPLERVSSVIYFARQHRTFFFLKGHASNIFNRNMY